MGCDLILRMTAASVSISHKAGTIIRDIMTVGNLGIVSKGVNDLQTEADRSAQKSIIASLQKQFPRATIVGEEEHDPDEKVRPEWVEPSQDQEVLTHQLPQDLRHVKEEDVVIWVDPLDGTSEYTQGLLDHVTVLIGICVGGKAVAGVMYQPYYNYKAGPKAELGRAIWGIIGLGSFGYEKKRAPEGQHIVTTTRSHSNMAVVKSVEACNPSSVLKAGGCGHKVLLILEGEAHAYVFASPGCKKWDTAAPEAIVHAAGGRLTDVHGNDLRYEADVQVRNAGGVIVTPRADMHQWYLERMPEEVKEELPPVVNY